MAGPLWMMMDGTGRASMPIKQRKRQHKGQISWFELEKKNDDDDIIDIEAAMGCCGILLNHCWLDNDTSHTKYPSIFTYISDIQFYFGMMCKYGKKVLNTVVQCTAHALFIITTHQFVEWIQFADECCISTQTIVSIFSCCKYILHLYI